MSGSVLLEALVALVLVGVALLMMLPLVLQDVRIASEATARREVIVAVEGTAEGMRAGAIPLRSASMSGDELPFANPVLSGVVISIDVRPAGVPDLHRVTIVGRAPSSRRPIVRRYESLIWRAGP